MTVTSCTMTLFDSEESRSSKIRTFTLFGVNRGGTTAVAGLFMRLGIYLGNTDGMEGNLEDKAFRRRKGIDSITTAINERNASHDVWGWKHPHPHTYLPQILPKLRNPRLVLVTRDITANAMGIEARGDEDDVEALNAVLKQVQRNLKFVLEHQLPTLMVSYEKLLINPRQTISEIADYASVAANAAQMEELVNFVRPGWYQPLPGRATIRQKLGQTIRQARSIWLPPR